mmetsp:Transcript_612/g.1941  ORF Transcript_612/g.1941 Transcript_612/m.1941 type:complete len:178 (+) Transcript_612:176-709(+)
MGQQFATECDGGNHAKCNQCYTPSATSGMRWDKDRIYKECCHMEGEAAIEIRIHYKHRQPQPYSCQSSQIGYDYPQGSQTVWFHGATTTPRPQSMVPTTGGPAMRVGGVGLPEGALDAATSSMAGPANPTAAASRENSYVESPSGYHSAPDSHRSATEMSSPRGGGGGGGAQEHGSS